ncbi:MAG: DUF1631 family protein [Alcanivoracaceae bacterium]|nr:DUF1631 family protein [Alcanivoracaceae bacterium]
MNQRAHIRHQITMPAAVSFTDFALNNCQVQDFCLGGMMLLIPSDDAQFLAAISAGDFIKIDLQVQGLRGMRAVSLNAKVMRKEGSSIGVSFESPNSTDLLAVQNHVRALRDADTTSIADNKKNRLSKQKTQQAADALMEVLRRFTIKRLEKFLPSAKEALVLAAEKVTNNQEQHPFFEASKVLGQQGETLSRNFVTNACKKLEELSHGIVSGNDDSAGDSSNSRLSLVDKEMFEDWLTLKVMATRAEGLFHDELLHLQLRMDELFNIALSARKNPLHPVVICNAFGESLRLLPLKQKTDKVILATFESEIIGSLGELYAEANQRLAQAGVLPDLDVGRYLSENYSQKPKQDASNANPAEPPMTNDAPSVTGANASTPQRTNIAHSAQQTPQGAIHSEPENDVAGATGASSGSEVAANTEARNDSGPASQNDSISPRAPEARPLQSAKRNSPAPTLAARQFALQQHIARHAYDTVKKLLSQSSMEEARIRSAQGLPDIPLAKDEHVVEALSSLQRSLDVQSADSPLAERVSAAINEGGSPEDTLQVNHEVQAAIDVIHHLFEGIIANPALSGRVQESIKRLEVPFLRLLLVDDSFLTQEAHPARQMLNRMARLGVRGSANLAAHEQEIDQEVEDVLQGFDNDINVFSSSLEKLDKMANRQQSLYMRNIKRVTESYEGKQKIVLARREVNQALERRIGGKEVPKAALSLIDAGWRQLLVQGLLRHGRDSREWHSYLGVIDQMIKAVEKVPSQEQLSELLAMIKNGLGQVDHTQMQNARLISELRDLLSQKARAETAPAMVNVPAGVVGAEDDEVVASDEVSARWIKRAQRYEVGDWFSNFDNGQETTVRLAWTDTDKRTYVFVNHQGMKIVELRVDDFAEKLSRGEIKPVDNLDAPAVDRGLENMVQRVYNQMAHQATHDDLTGLFNRREFERLLKQRLSAHENSASLLHIDIDQFKVVNTYGGPEAGDDMIQEMAKLVAESFPGNLIARLSGDEFAVWLENIPPEAAQRIAETFGRRVDDERFICAGNPYSITVSIGAAARQGSESTAPELMRSASSACQIAKESGRNRVQRYSPDDKDQVKRDDVMAWVARLNDAIDNDRLLLRCQRIESTVEGEQLPAYEVLISIASEDGEILAPSEFLHAAERYNRMHALDRWVVSNVLRWMHGNPQVVDQLDHLSINLSGHSLNDSSLLEFLFEHFQRYPVPRERICFEVTETAAIANLEDAADFIRELQGLGCRFSLDDFGSGLASYGHLKHLPVDYIKIDGSFIRDVADDPADLALVSSINEMGHLMGKRTIAEYVENDRIRDCMRTIGVDYVQGYGVEKPRPLDSLATQTESI